MQKLLYYLFPGICILCGLPSKRTLDLCAACENELPYIKNPCCKCSIELGTEIKSNTICGQCLTNPLPFDKTIALFKYHYPVDHLITGLKFAEKLIYASILGKLLAKKLANFYQNQNLPELIIPVPLHKKRQQQRGFNQAIEISRPIAKQFKIPIDKKSCLRIKNTEAQSSLPAKQRNKNIKNAFQIIKPIKAKHIAIIDDVITTGNTITELSKTLRHADIDHIDVWSIAKTV